MIGLAVALGAIACGPSGRAPGSCRANADCASDAHCRANACVASAAPVASLTANADQEYWTNYILHFDGAGMVDPASGEQIVEYRWTFDGPLAELCPPVVRSPPGPGLDVYFTCPGDWDVRLVVVDGRGFAGAPTVQHITVKAPPPGIPLSGADVPPIYLPRLEMGETVLVDHRCHEDRAKAGGYTCTLEDADLRTSVSLLARASAAPEVGGELQYAWTCSAPESLRNTASPSLAEPSSATPELKVETDGPVISGDYTCVVTVTDARQQRISGTQIVRVGNRPPIVTPAADGPILAPHHLETSVYVATAPLPKFTHRDPDDDPMELGPFVAVDGNAGSLTAFVEAALSVRVPKELPQSLLGPDVTRTLRITASDSNGGKGSASWPVVVLNRPPRWYPASGSLSVQHTFDGKSYTASAALGHWVDDDADPVELDPTGDAICTVASVPVSQQGELYARADCKQGFTDISSISSLLAPHVLSVGAHDPWSPAAAAHALVTVLDRPPAAVPAKLDVPVGAQTGACCRWEVDPETHAKFCLEKKMTYPAGSIARTNFGQTDPEGDPVVVTVTPRPPVPGVTSATATVSSTTTVCKGGSCTPIYFQMPSASGCSTTVEAPTAMVDVTVDDGTGPVPGGSFLVESF
jgi:hypothetical protein